MDRFSKNVYEMLQRVIAFAVSEPQRFPEGSVQQAILQQITRATEILSEHVVSQSSTHGRSAAATSERSAARSELRVQLEAIARTARALGLSQFLLPAARHDTALVHVGAAWAQQAEPVKAAFIELQLPGDFLERLKSAVERLQKSVQQSTVSKSARMAATKSIDACRVEVFSLLQRLDPVLENLLSAEPTALSAWRHARRVERGSSRRVSRLSAPDVVSDPPVPSAGSPT